jgi:hypothetical protein
LGLLLWVPVAAKSARGFKGVLLRVGVLGVAAIYVWVGTAMMERLTNRLSNPNDISTAGRFEIYQKLPAYLWHHWELLIAGVGASNVAVEWFLKRVLDLGTIHAHDLLLQLLTAYGLAGIGLLGMLILPLLRRGRRFPDDDTRALRWFGLTLVIGQVIQYGLFEEKLLLAFTMTIGYVATATARPRVETAS